MEARHRRKQRERGNKTEQTMNLPNITPITNNNLNFKSSRNVEHSEGFTHTLKRY